MNQSEPFKGADYDPKYQEYADRKSAEYKKEMREIKDALIAKPHSVLWWTWYWLRKGFWR